MSDVLRGRVFRADEGKDRARGSLIVFRITAAALGCRPPP